MRFILIIILFLSSSLIGQDASPKIYWNSLATAVNIGVPLDDDKTLKGGRIQIRVSFDQGKTFSDLGNPSPIGKGDIDDLKDISIPGYIFEAMKGFKEGGEAHFIAEIWDKAGNSVLGEVSDSVLTIDETIPTISSLKVTSSNSLDPDFAITIDSLVFDLVTSEPIQSPKFKINGDEYEAIGFEKSWKTFYPAEDADDGPITFEINFNDIAQNPGEPVESSSDKKIITKDGTLPELDSINLFTSNQHDSSLAIKGDTVFLRFTATEIIRNIDVKLDSQVSQQLEQDSLTFIYFYIFTESDSEGVIPISIDYMDLAGNVGETIDETTDDSEVTFDMTPPTSFKIERVGSIQSKQKKMINTESDSVKVSNEINSGISGIPQLYLMIIAGVVGFLCLLVWFSWYKIFSKTGQSGWKAFIPFFNIFVFTKIVQKPIWWLTIYLILPVGYILAALHISKVFSKKIIFALGLIFIPFVFYPILAFGKSQVGGEQSVDKKPTAKPKKKTKKKK